MVGTGGFGVWWPRQDHSTEYKSQMPAETYAHQDVTDHVIGLWNKMAGQANSSTRMEIAGSLIAMTRAIPLRIASDSKAMIDKAMALRQHAIDRNSDPEAAWWPKRNPMGKPWGVQADGDLWKLMWEALLT